MCIAWEVMLPSPANMGDDLISDRMLMYTAVNVKHRSMKHWHSWTFMQVEFC